MAHNPSSNISLWSFSDPTAVSPHHFKVCTSKKCIKIFQVNRFKICSKSTKFLLWKCLHRFSVWYKLQSTFHSFHTYTSLLPFTPLTFSHPPFTLAGRDFVKSYLFSLLKQLRQRMINRLRLNRLGFYLFFKLQSSGPPSPSFRCLPIYNLSAC